MHMHSLGNKEGYSFFINQVVELWFWVLGFAEGVAKGDAGEGMERWAKLIHEDDTQYSFFSPSIATEMRCFLGAVSE